MKYILIAVLAFLLVNVALCEDELEGAGEDGERPAGSVPLGSPLGQQRKRRDIEQDVEHLREKRSVQDPDEKSEADGQVRKKREAEEIARVKREVRLLDGSAITRELADDQPVKKRKRREIVRIDHDAEMTAEEHERWKRSAAGGRTGEGGPNNQDPELGQK